MTEAKSEMMCHLCTTLECRHGYPAGITPSCMAGKFHKIIDQTKDAYSTPDDIEIYKAAASVVNNGYGK